MDTFKFVTRKVDSEVFVSVIPFVEGETVNPNKTLYDTTEYIDEETARIKFLESGYLPSEKFEELLAEAKEL